MDRRAFLLALAGAPCWRPGPALAGGKSADSAAVEFGQVLPGRRLVFPDDHGAHPEFRSEWWYATGWLSLPDGRPLGFQSTFFRVRTGIGESNPSAFAPRQLILAHAAIADPQLGRLRHEQRAARASFGQAGCAQGHTEVWIGDWRFDQHNDRYQAQVRGDDFSYALTLAPDGPPMLNGVAGFSAKSQDSRHASYYYSRPQLGVSGQVTLAGRMQKVTGLAWMDHEWSSELLPDEAQGWDWLGLNLENGDALMAFRLRRRDNAAPWSAATFRRAGGRAQPLPPEAVDFTPLRHWRSPRTGVDYPVEWQLRIGDRLFRLQPLMDDQELDSRRTTGAIYWEGAVRAEQDGSTVGRGYLEMTGYGEAIRFD